MTSIADILVFKDPGAKRVVIGLFGPDLGEKLALFMGRGKSLDWRKVLEPKDAVDQCNKTVGELTTAPCYLCGQIPDKQRKFTDPLYAECEHILPVTTARWFLTLYMGKEQLTDEWTKGILSVEYAWAHRICNQTKSNANFLKKDETGSVMIDDASLDAVLKEIGEKAGQLRSAKKQDSDALAAIAALATEEGRKAQKDRIVQEKLQPIVDLLNKGPPDDKLLMLARTVGLMDSSFLSSGANEIIRKYYTDEGKVGDADAAIADATTKASEFKAAVKAEVEEISNPTNLPEFIRGMLPADYDKDVFAGLIAKIETGTPTVKADDFPPDARTAVAAEWEELSNGHKADPVVDIYANALVASMSASPSPTALPADYPLLVSEFCTYFLTSALWRTLDDAWKRAHIPFTCRLIAVQTSAGTRAKDFLNKGELDATLEDHNPYADMCAKHFESTQESELTAKQLAQHEKTVAPTKEEVKAFKKAGTPQETVSPIYQQIVDLQDEIAKLKKTLNDPTLTSSARTTKEASLRKTREALLTVLQAPEPTGLPEKEVQEMIRKLKLKLGQGRRTRRAKLSRHTKRARHSGRSTKLRRRSFRKSPRGRRTKTSRCGIQPLSGTSSVYKGLPPMPGRGFR